MSSQAAGQPQAAAGGPSRGPGLTFAATRLEEVYLVYTAEKNRGLTLRLHFMLVAAWAVGALKTLSQLLLAVQQGEARMLPQYAFLLLAQLVNLGYQCYAMRRLRSLARSEQLLQEQTKAWLHILLDIAVMVCVMLSDPSLPHAPAPLPTLVVTAFLGVMDMIRLDTLLRLYAIKWLCFLFLETDHYLRAPGHGATKVGFDVASALLLGTLLPLALATVSEASQRAAFLRDCKRPLSNLGRFWSGVHSVVRRFSREPAEEAEDNHVD